MSLKKILEEVWNKNKGSYTCPHCHSSLVMIQMEPIEDKDNLYTPYKTIVECPSCSYCLETESFSILGSVKDFDLYYVEIGSWSPSGCRVLSKYEHLLSYDLLKKLKKSGELVEFLISNKQVVQVIG